MTCCRRSQAWHSQLTPSSWYPCSCPPARNGGVAEKRRSRFAPMLAPAPAAALSVLLRLLACRQSPLLAPPFLKHLRTPESLVLQTSVGRLPRPGSTLYLSRAWCARHASHQNQVAMHTGCLPIVRKVVWLRRVRCQTASGGYRGACAARAHLVDNGAPPAKRGDGLDRCLARQARRRLPRGLVMSQLLRAQGMGVG